MKLPFFNKDKPRPDRTEMQGLINEPVEMWVGGAGEHEAKKILVRETSSMTQAKHVGMVVQGITDILSANKEILDVLSSPKMLKKGHMFLFASFPAAIRDVIADLVGEDSAYVEDEMTGRQVSAVLATYMELIGFDQLKRTFEWTLQSWTQAGETAEEEKPIEPPSPVESVSKSPDIEALHQSKSGTS